MTTVINYVLVKLDTTNRRILGALASLSIKQNDLLSYFIL